MPSCFSAVQIHSQGIAVIDGARNKLRDLRLGLLAGLLRLGDRILSLGEGLPGLHCREEGGDRQQGKLRG